MTEAKYVQQFKKGTLEMVLLSLIARGETYGYELLTALVQNGNGLFGAAREGTVYPILYRLEDAGLLHCRMAPSGANGGMKKYYSLTSRGRETLEEMAAFWQEYSAGVDRFLALSGVRRPGDGDREGAAAPECTDGPAAPAEERGKAPAKEKPVSLRGLRRLRGAEE